MNKELVGVVELMGAYNYIMTQGQREDKEQLW